MVSRAVFNPQVRSCYSLSLRVRVKVLTMASNVLEDLEPISLLFSVTVLQPHKNTPSTCLLWDVALCLPSCLEHFALASTFLPSSLHLLFA